MLHWKTAEASSSDTPIIISSIVDASAGENRACVLAINAVSASDESELVLKTTNRPPLPLFPPLWISPELYQSHIQPPNSPVG